jgi:hypothetical protein
VGGDTQRGIEAFVESAVEFGEIRVQAVLRVWVLRVDWRHVDHRRGHRPIHS